MSSLALEMAELALAALALELRHAFVHIFLAAGEHGVDQARELVRGRLDRACRVEPSQACTMTRPDDEWL